jgi:hypothetical protein
MAVFTITVEPKTEVNRFYRKGADVCYYITGTKDKKEAPLLKLQRVTENGKPTRYAFDINTKGYPLVLECYEGKEKKILCGPIEKGRLKFYVTSDFPDLVHYSCADPKYPDMGGPIEIESKDQIEIIPLSIKKPIRNGIKLKSYKNKLYLGLSTCQIYRLDELVLENILDIREATNMNSLKLHDFEFISETRILALVSGLGKKIEDKKQKNILDLILGKKVKTVSLFTIKPAPNSCLLLDFPILYAFSDELIYRVDISIPGEIVTDEENEDDELWITGPTIPKAILYWNEKFIFLNEDIWVSENKIGPCGIDVTTAVLCNEREMLIGNNKGSLGLLKIEGKKFSPEWECRLPAGLVSLCKCENKIYCLINTFTEEDEKSTIYILERY